MKLLDPILHPLIREGSLRVIDWNGESRSYGDGSGVPVEVRLHDPGTGWRLLLDPQLEAGEAYTDGRLTIEKGTLYDFLELIFRSAGLQPMSYPMRGLTEKIRDLLRRFDQFNPASRSARNVAHHYDLSDILYENFLDEDRQYSCGYFLSENDTLEEAQIQKKRHLAAKLLLEDGHRVLDIGSGWGGLGCIWHRPSARR